VVAIPHRFSLAIPSHIAVFQAEIVINTASSLLAHVSPRKISKSGVVKNSSKINTNHLI